jgi:transcriptional regulator with XRE-family HTH domain
MQTRLAQFMKANGITSEQLATKAGVAVSTVEDARRGRTDPRRPTIVWMTGAARRILRRRVRASELFDLGDDE